MALKSIQLENFRNKADAVYQFGPGLNQISGRNGSGKSSIKEAICYVFCGTDSVGTRNPQHLIARSADSMRVTVQTDRAEISRSLTRKGNGTLKLIREGVPYQLTQTQLEQMLAPTDLFLSVLIPGFFMTLGSERQHKVLADCMPKIDRAALIAELAGFPLQPEELVRYDLSRRADLVLSVVSGDRREVEKTIATRQGSVQQLRQTRPVTKPQDLGWQARLDALVAREASQAEYWKQFNAQNQGEIAVKAIRHENAMKAERRAALKAEIAGLVEKPKPEFSVLDVKSMQSDMLPEPAKPLLMTVVETDGCPTCGQPVGSHHRESVKAENDRIMDRYRAELASVQAHNQVVLTAIQQASAQHEAKRAEYRRIEQENNQIAARRQRLATEMSQYQDRELPVIPSITVEKPETEQDLSGQIAELKQALELYRADMARYSYVEGLIAGAAEQIKTLEHEIQVLQSRADRLGQIEDALKRLPAEEMKRQTGALELGSVKLLVDKEVTCLVDGVPYGLLSTGQSMDAAVAVSACLNGRMPRPINMMFLDNADLLDHQIHSSLQTFVAHVKPDQNEVVVIG